MMQTARKLTAAGDGFLDGMQHVILDRDRLYTGAFRRLLRDVLLGEAHLRAAVREFVDHYHEERPHQGLGNELIAPPTTVIRTGDITSRERLGGLLKFYYRHAA